MIPIRLEPLSDESLPGFVRRLANANHLSDVLLLNRSGLGTGSRPPAFWGLVTTPEVARVATTEWGLEPNQLQRMVLEASPGFDLASLHGPRTSGNARNAQRTQWLHLSEHKHCGECWSDGYRGRISWLLPWSIACPEHRVLLKNGGANTAMSQLASDHVMEVNAAATAQVAQGQVDLWGDAWPSFDVWQVWRGVACLLVAAEAIRPWTSRPWLSPPGDLAILTDVLVTTAKIVRQPTVNDSARILVEVAPKLRQLHATGALRDAVGPQPALQPLLGELAESLGRVSAGLRSRARQMSILHPAARIEWLPTLAPSDALPPCWRGRLVPHPLLQRVVVAAAAAKLVGAKTWLDVGIGLGFDPLRLTRWVRYVLTKVGSEARFQIATAGSTLVEQSLSERLEQPRPLRPMANLGDLAAWDEVASTDRPVTFFMTLIQGFLAAGPGMTYCPCFTS